MKRKQTWVALVLMLLLAVSLTACGGEDSSPQKKDYVPATVENNIYTSQFAGLTATLDNTWTVLNDEEIAQIVGFSIDMTDDESLKESLGNGKTIYDLYATAEDGSTLNVTVGDLGAIYGKLLDVETIAATSAEQLAPAFESMGFTDVITEVTAFTFAGSTQTAIVLQGNYMDVPMYEILVCMKVENYSFNVTACSYGTDRTAEILALFQSL